MIKSALIALDGSKSSETATELGIRFAEEYGIKLCGIGVLDVPTITAPEASGAMGAGFKEETDRAVLRDAEQRVKEFLGRFERSCTSAGVDHACIQLEGSPAERIERASLLHDLIVIGKDSNFYFATSDQAGETVKRLLRENPRPVIVMPDELPQGQNVMLAYDGSLQSSRALHMFLLLGLARDRAVDLVSVHKDKDEAKRLCEEAELFLTTRGLNVSAHPIASHARPREVLLAQVQTLNVGMVAMGAFGLRGLREIFLGSSTREMVRRCPVPVFVHH